MIADEKERKPSLDSTTTDASKLTNVSSSSSSQDHNHLTTEKKASMAMLRQHRMMRQPRKQKKKSLFITNYKLQEVMQEARTSDSSSDENKDKGKRGHSKAGVDSMNKIQSLDHIKVPQIDVSRILYPRKKSEPCVVMEPLLEQMDGFVTGHIRSVKSSKRADIFVSSKKQDEDLQKILRRNHY